MSARVCPLPMRRERSDLCASSCHAVSQTHGTQSWTHMHNEHGRKTAANGDSKTPAITAARHGVRSKNDKQLQRNNWDSSQRNGEESPRYTSRASQREHRMSVPNLSPEPSSVVIQSAKALKEKLGRNGDGELSTINEGLITPVIRRKQFNQPSTLTFNVNDDAPLSNSPSAKRAIHTNTNSPSTLVSRGREALEALFVHQQNTSPPNTLGGGLAR
ncbi:hypothetical protein OSTOST_03751, partial [Ostertagia ostertagi]